MIRILAIALLLGSSLPTLKYRALDSNGDALSGAKLYFYETGTTTPLATYSDEALSSANANPVVSDSGGLFGEIYMKTDDTYRVKLTTSADVTQWTLDNINAAQLASDAFQTRLKQAASNPLDYGAVGDGVADESSEVQDAIDNATGVVDLLGKTYRCDSTVTLSTGLTLKNGTLDFSNSTDTTGVSVNGTLGSANLLTANSTRGDLVLDVTDGSAIGEGDLLYLYSGNGKWGSKNMGEIVQVDSVSVNAVTILDPVEGEYNTANSSAVKEITPASSVRIENVEILGPTVIGNRLINVAYASNFVVTKSRFTGFKTSAIQAGYSIDLRIDDCVFEDSSSSGSAIYLDGTVQNAVIAKNTFRRVVTGIQSRDSNSQHRHVTVSNNVFTGVTQAVLSLGGTQYLRIEDNDIMSDTTGTATTGAGIRVLDAVDLVIAGNAIREAGGHGIIVDMSNMVYTGVEPNGQVISGNSIRDCDDDCINAVPDLDTDLTIAGNSMVSCGDEGIEIAAAATAVGSIIVDGNELNVASGGGPGVFLTGGESLLNPIIRDNKISGSATQGIYVDGSVSGVIVDGNVVNGTSSMVQGILLEGINGPEIRVVNNQVRDVGNASGQGISIDNDTNVTTTPVIVVDGNDIEVVTGAQEGIYVYYQTEAATTTSVSGNTIDASNGIVLKVDTASENFIVADNTITVPAGAARHTIEISGSAKKIAVNGNMLTCGDDAGANILLSGAGAGLISDMSFTGNIFDNGTYAISEAVDANNTNIQIGGNYYSSIATGEYDGTVVPATVVKAAANTACNTTCGDLTCFSGYDDGVPAVVICTDATADRCVCFP